MTIIYVSSSPAGAACITICPLTLGLGCYLLYGPQQVAQEARCISSPGAETGETPLLRLRLGAGRGQKWPAGTLKGTAARRKKMAFLSQTTVRNSLYLTIRILILPAELLIPRNMKQSKTTSTGP